MRQYVSIPSEVAYFRTFTTYIREKVCNFPTKFRLQLTIQYPRCITIHYKTCINISAGLTINVYSSSYTHICDRNLKS